MKLPSLFTKNEMVVLEGFSATLALCRTSKNAWQYAASIIPSDAHEAVLHGLNVGCAFGLLTSLSIPSSLKSAYQAASSDKPLGDRIVKVIAHMGDVVGSTAISMQSLSIIIDVTRPFFEATTPLLFISVGMSSFYLVGHVKDLWALDPNSVDHKVARLRTVAIIVRVIGVVCLAAVPGVGVVVATGCFVVATALNFRATWLKQNDLLNATDRAVERLAERHQLKPLRSSEEESHTRLNRFVYPQGHLAFAA